MMRKKQNSFDFLRKVLEHSMDLMSGKIPRKGLIIDGPMKTRNDMIIWLKRWRNDGCVPKLVMSKGKWFEGRASINDYPVAVEWRRRHRLKTGRCFQNARQFCISHPSTRYFEGFYLILETPHDHAWVVMEDGKVLDFTHEATIRKLINEKKEVHITPPLYFGIEVPNDALFRLHASVARTSPVLELYVANQCGL